MKPSMNSNAAEISNTGGDVKRLMDNLLNKVEYWRKVSIQKAGRKEVGEDIFQEAYISIQKHVNKYGPGVEGEPELFIEKTIENAASHYHRRNKRYEPADNDELLELIINENKRAASGAFNDLSNNEPARIVSSQLFRDVDGFVKSLPPKERFAQELVIKHDGSIKRAYKEIEETWNYATFKNTVSNGRKKLTQFLQLNGWMEKKKGK